VHARLDGLERPLEVEVDIRDDRDGGLGEDLGEGRGVLLLGDGDADDVRAGGGELVDLRDALVDVVGVPGGHGLDGDGGIAPDADDAGGVVAEADLSCGASGLHGHQG
jgi:hypothetical protein